MEKPCLACSQWIDRAKAPLVLEHILRMFSPEPPPVDSVAEIIGLYKRDIDRSLLRRQLARTPEQRFRDVMDRQAAVEEFRRAGREARRSK